ncbi:hypothetical protein BW899_00230 [Bacillus mycoides]|uniref:hypothetical protein n=1 Tax=Bacillus TaxID=1386 RepID=UPI000992D8BE|nr:hypothetical protein [Bacillus mycoides]OOR02017.1 hypothetical protein BW899_00230 [Bacillus mycoides]QWI59256.1 hypothetical protein EXW57_05480 [Bacillus mycoides]HDR7586452.1 hypothetical protein [Bacillus mycoides]
MRKIVFAVAGFVFTLSVLSSNQFSNNALNKGDGGAPARPDYVNIGDTGGAPADNRGDGGAPANFNKGDGGGISKQDSHADHF